MNIEDMIFNGASDEEIQKALDQIKAEKAKQEEALRAEEKRKAESAQKAQRKEALKAEARAYLLNALIAYSSAFDLTDEEWTEEEVARAEVLIKRLEQAAPMYIKMYELQSKLDQDIFGFGFGRM